MSSGDVLILNSDGHPLSIIPLSVISWQEAIKLLYQDKVTPVEFYPDWAVHSQNLVMQVPTIVITKKYHETATRIRFTKANLYWRDNGTCQYCGNHFAAKDLTLDHVTPRCYGGKKVWDNIVLACGPCNWQRSDDISVRPIRMPRKPTYYQLVSERKKFPISISHESWKLFLNWSEDLVIVGSSPEEKYNISKII